MRVCFWRGRRIWGGNCLGMVIGAFSTLATSPFSPLTALIPQVFPSSLNCQSSSAWRASFHYAATCFEKSASTSTGAHLFQRVWGAEVGGGSGRENVFVLLTKWLAVRVTCQGERRAEPASVLPPSCPHRPPEEANGQLHPR